MTFHIEVPPPRRVGDRVEALRSGYFHPGQISQVLNGGQEFTVRWDDPRVDNTLSRVRAADVRAHPRAQQHDQPRQRFAVTCPPGCAYPSSFVAQIPTATTQPPAQVRTPPPVPRGSSRFSRTPSMGRLVVGSDDGAHSLAGGASLFAATSSEFSTADSFAMHQQALQKIINDTIRPSQRERARLDALREYNQSGRRCLSQESATATALIEAFGLTNAFATEGRRSLEVCTCKELCHLTLRRERLVEDAALQLLHDNTSRSLRRQLIVKFEGEDGIDEGGLSKSNRLILKQSVNQPGTICRENPLYSAQTPVCANACLCAQLCDCNCAQSLTSWLTRGLALSCEFDGNVQPRIFMAASSRNSLK
jgi:hypothetical protein